LGRGKNVQNVAAPLQRDLWQFQDGPKYDIIFFVILPFLR